VIELSSTLMRGADVKNWIAWVAMMVSAGCSGGAEGLVRWSSQRCAQDGGSSEGGDASLLLCDAVNSRAANTVLPMPKPDPRVLRCFSRSAGSGAARTFEVGFDARDPSGATLTLRGERSTAASAAMVGSEVTSCVVALSEGAVRVEGRCGQQCRVTITGFTESTGTVAGRIQCDGLAESDMLRAWRVRNAEGVPGDSADFALAHCEAPGTVMP
jgi:hypothetical protein